MELPHHPFFLTVLLASRDGTLTLPLPRKELSGDEANVMEMGGTRSWGHTLLVERGTSKGPLGTPQLIVLPELLLKVRETVDQSQHSTSWAGMPGLGLDHSLG